MASIDAEFPDFLIRPRPSLVGRGLGKPQLCEIGSPSALTYALAKKDEYIIRDASIAGFGLRVRSSGAMTYVLEYRSPETRQSRRYKEARRLRAEIDLGADPASDRKRERGGITFAEAYSLYRREQLAFRRESYLRWSVMRFNAHLLPKLGPLPLASITRASIQDIVGRSLQRKKAGEANNIFKVARAFLGWCFERDWIPTNPLRGLKLPAKAQPRRRVLDPEEFTHVWMAASHLKDPWSKALRLLMATGLRHNEVLGARFTELDLASATWVIPPERSKNHSAHTVYLNELALAIVRSIPRVNGQEFLFESGRKPGGPLTGFNQRVHGCSELMRVEGWCLHDLRRSVATHMAGMKIPQEVVEVVLNHRTFRSGLTGTYNRYSYADEARGAWQAWSTRLKDWIENGPPKKAPPPVAPRWDEGVVI